MNCEHCQELLPASERAELPPELQTEVAAHLRTCVDCTRASAALRELNTLLDTEIAPSPGLRTRVLARLEQEAARGPAPAVASASLFARLWPSRPLGAFSYSFALVLCGVFGGQLLPGSADIADIPAERLYQLCPVPDGPSRDIL